MELYTQGALPLRPLEYTLGTLPPGPPRWGAWPLHKLPCALRRSRPPNPQLFWAAAEKGERLAGLVGGRVGYVQRVKSSVSLGGCCSPDCSHLGGCAPRILYTLEVALPHLSAPWVLRSQIPALGGCDTKALQWVRFLITMLRPFYILW